MIKKDKLINFYKVIPKEFQVNYPLDKNFKKHLIEPCSNIFGVGATGAGKNNAITNFLIRKPNSFGEIIVFCGSTADEPLYNYLKKLNPQIQMITDVEEMPSLSDYEDNKKCEKLIIFDDVAKLGKKQEEKMEKFVKASRKYGFTCIFLYQTYTSAPKFIRDNCNIFLIFKCNSNVSLNFILRDREIDVSKKVIENMYNYSVEDPLDFFCIDLKASKDTRFRHNYYDVLNPRNFI